MIPDPIAQLRRDHPAGFQTRRKNFLFQDPFHRRSQKLLTAFEYAANDNAFRIQPVDDDRKAVSEHFPCDFEHLLREHAALCLSNIQIAHGKIIGELAVFLRGFPEFSRFRKHGGVTCNAGSSAESLERSRFSIAFRTGRTQADMTEFTRHPGRSFVKASIQDDASAETGTHREEDHIAAAASRAVFPFRERAGVCIVHQECGDPELPAYHVRDRNAVPARQIRGRENNAFLGIERAPAADSGGKEFGSGDPGIGEQFSRMGNKIIPGFRESAGGRKFDFFAWNAIRSADDDGAFRAADVESEIMSFCHDSPFLLLHGDVVSRITNSVGRILRGSGFFPLLSRNSRMDSAAILPASVRERWIVVRGGQSLELIG